MDINPTLTQQIRIEPLRAMRVAYYQCFAKEPETEGRNYLDGWLAQNHVGAPVRHFGFEIGVTLEQQAQGLRGYEVWSTVPGSVRPSAGVMVTDYPGGLYASLLIENPFDDPYGKIPQYWKALHEWVISSDNYRGASHQCLEELLIHPDKSDLKLYYPVIRVL